MEGMTASSNANWNGASLVKIRHELRTSINHIIGYAEIIREEFEAKLPDGFFTDLDKIHGSGYVLISLINRYFCEDYIGTEKTYPHSVCHELRTTVNHIIGYGELLTDQCDELGQPDLKSDLGNIVSAAYSCLASMEAYLGKILAQIKDAPTNQFLSGRLPSTIRHQITGDTPLQDKQPGSPCCGHLLLADDDETNRDILRRRLEKLGYRITICRDGQEALDIIQQVSPDLVLLDMLMPVMDGHEVLVRIKSDEKLHHLPVIMISALDQVEEIAHCIELGAEDYLAKPFNPILLRSRIGAALEKKRLRDIEQVYLRQIEEERTRSDKLLLNVLPQPIANRLKNGESHIVNSYDEVTVMFADLVGCTILSTKLSPVMLVSLLDQIFSAFDELADRHGLEKIKTIGDAYMAAAGVPFPHSDHAAATVRMAMDMHKIVETFNRQARSDLQMRIGICTGPVIAGIIGQNRFIYDLWGDTVNTASRMESHGLPGKTQVTGTTYELLRERFQFEERGTIEVKGKGPMKTYFICAV